jgi:hypothetical protein
MSEFDHIFLQEKEQIEKEKQKEKKKSESMKQYRDYNKDVDKQNYLFYSLFF